MRRYGGVGVSKDISTQYTKQQNKECGRRGYGMWKNEKSTVISPKDYGMFMDRQKKSKRGTRK